MTVSRVVVSPLTAASAMEAGFVTMVMKEPGSPVNVARATYPMRTLTGPRLAYTLASASTGTWLVVRLPTFWPLTPQPASAW
ncbi:hypothetical protein D3C87_1654100 [compost metagenome]